MQAKFIRNSYLERRTFCFQNSFENRFWTLLHIYEKFEQSCNSIIHMFMLLI